MEKYRYYELTEQEKNRITSRVAEILGRHDEVKLALIFGSLAEHKEFRDIDVAVYVHGKNELQAATDLAIEPEEALNTPVDVVPLNALPAKFKHSVLTKGTVILEKTPGLYEALLNQALDEILLEETSA